MKIISSASLQKEYTIVGKIGEGGMGVVYKAIQKSLSRDVAIKVIKAGSNKITARRFEREMEITGQLDHANIAKVYAAGVVNDNRYIIMDYIAGVRYCRKKSIQILTILLIMGNI